MATQGLINMMLATHSHNEQHLHQHQKHPPVMADHNGHDSASSDDVLGPSYPDDCAKGVTTSLMTVNKKSEVLLVGNATSTDEELFKDCVDPVDASSGSIPSESAMLGKLLQKSGTYDNNDEGGGINGPVDCSNKTTYLKQVVSTEIDMINILNSSSGLFCDDSQLTDGDGGGNISCLLDTSLQARKPLLDSSVEKAIGTTPNGTATGMSQFITTTRGKFWKRGLPFNNASANKVVKRGTNPTIKVTVTEEEEEELVEGETEPLKVTEETNAEIDEQAGKTTNKKPLHVSTKGIGKFVGSAKNVFSLRKGGGGGANVYQTVRNEDEHHPLSVRDESTITVTDNNNSNKVEASPFIPGLENVQNIDQDEEQEENIHDIEQECDVAKLKQQLTDHNTLGIITECTNPDYHNNLDLQSGNDMVKVDGDNAGSRSGTLLSDKLNSLTRVFANAPALHSVFGSKVNPTPSSHAAAWPWRSTKVTTECLSSQPGKKQSTNTCPGANGEPPSDNMTTSESLDSGHPSNSGNQSVGPDDIILNSNESQSHPDGTGRAGSRFGSGRGGTFNRFFFYSRIPEGGSFRKEDYTDYPLKDGNSQKNGDGQATPSTNSCCHQHTHISNRYDMQIPGRMEELFSEPKCYHSYDLVWNSSKSCFSWLTLVLYRLCTAILAVPLALIWALIMAVSCVLHVWVCSPVISFVGIWMELLQRVWWFCCKTCITPIVEAFWLGKWNAVNNPGGRGCAHCCAKNNPQHVIHFDGKNGDVIMTNGSETSGKLNELETKP